MTEELQAKDLRCLKLLDMVISIVSLFIKLY